MGTSLIEITMAIFLVAIITMGALFYYGRAVEQARLRDSANGGSEPRQLSQNIDKPAPRHSSSGPISNLESF